MNRSSTQIFSFLGKGDCALPEKDIASIQLDSRKIGPGALFVALQGMADNGARYIGRAFEKGAAYALTDDASAQSERVIYVSGLREKLVSLLDYFFGNPLGKLLCIAITGTNGKTTAAALISKILEAAGHKVMNFGTIQNSIGDKVLPARLTTPDPVTLFEMIHAGIDAGCTALVMEASSHALSQHRVGRMFHRAVFTNLTRDHLDYHKTFENYYQAKKRLFTRCILPGGMAVINSGNEYGRRLAGELTDSVFTYQVNNRSGPGPDVGLTPVFMGMSGTTVKLASNAEAFEAYSSLVGRINLENLAAAYATGLSLKINPGLLVHALEDVQVRGRNEKVDLGMGAIAVIDYAHTPDALERVLKSFRPMVKGRLLCVFGCGGDRDRSKRAVMAEVAESNSDNIVITNDNPRSEDPERIVADITSGLKNKEKALVVLDRKEAIENSLSRLGAEDCVIIAGKGHEDYQIMGEVRRHFSDREVVENWVKNHPKGAVHG